MYRRQQLVLVWMAAVCAVAPVTARASSAEREAIRKAVDTLLSQPPLLGTRASVEVVSLDDGAIIYSRGADEALNPASNTKLVTAAAALLRLGPEFRFESFSDGKVLEQREVPVGLARSAIIDIPGEIAKRIGGGK